MRDDFKNESEMIKAIRSETGLTQERFHDLYGIPKRTIENWESGYSCPPDHVITCLRLCVSKGLEFIPTDGTPLRELREKAGVSRAAFAKKYNIKIQTLEDWEFNRHRCPDYVSSLIERCFRSEEFPIYFCIYKDCYPKERKGMDNGTGWYILHSMSAYGSEKCTPEHINFKEGFYNPIECLEQAKKKERVESINNKKYDIYVLKCEDVFKVAPWPQSYIERYYKNPKKIPAKKTAENILYHLHD